MSSQPPSGGNTSSQDEQTPRPAILIGGVPTYGIKEIVDSNYRYGHLAYRVLWDLETARDYSWYNADKFQNATELLERFHRDYPSAFTQEQANARAQQDNEEPQRPKISTDSSQRLGGSRYVSANSPIPPLWRRNASASTVDEPSTTSRNVSRLEQSPDQTYTSSRQESTTESASNPIVEASTGSGNVSGIKTPQDQVVEPSMESRNVSGIDRPFNPTFEPSTGVSGTVSILKPIVETDDEFHDSPYGDLPYGDPPEVRQFYRYPVFPPDSASAPASRATSKSPTRHPEYCDAIALRRMSADPDADIDFDFDPYTYAEANTDVNANISHYKPVEAAEPTPPFTPPFPITKLADTANTPSRTTSPVAVPPVAPAAMTSPRRTPPLRPMSPMTSSPEPRPLSPSGQIFSAWSGFPNRDIITTIREMFKISDDDHYVYRVHSFAMTLSQIQEALNNPFLKYIYKDTINGETVEAIVSPADISAYATIFSPSTNTPNSLKSFLANARKGSAREIIARYLESQRIGPIFLVPKSRRHINPYYDIWALSCQITGFIGPLPDPSYQEPEAAKVVHPLLPVFYHHFGCAVPSYEALHIILACAKRLSGIIDMGSGNGYWTYMLRRVFDKISVTAVDNMFSKYRTMWITDTVKADGVEWLKRNEGGKDKVLLLVYPITTGNFTRRIFEAYTGDTVIIVGTQNQNRLTGFSDFTIEDWFTGINMAANQAGERGWRLEIRIALPSFAGKDEAMSVWRKLDGAST